MEKIFKDLTKGRNTGYRGAGTEELEAGRNSW